LSTILQNQIISFEFYPIRQSHRNRDSSYAAIPIYLFFLSTRVAHMSKKILLLHYSRFFFSQAYRNEGDFEQSKKELKRAQDYDPNNKAIKDALIDLDRLGRRIVTSIQRGDPRPRQGPVSRMS